MKNIFHSLVLSSSVSIICCITCLASIPVLAHAQDNRGSAVLYSGYNEETLRTVTVVTDSQYPPYSFIGESGVLEGISVDLWKEWESVTGIKVDIKGVAWNLAIETIEQGKADVIDTLFITDDRKRKYLFTDTYAEIDVPVFIHRSINGAKSLSDLKGFTVAVKNGDSCIQYLEEAGISNLAEFRSYNDIVRAAKMLEIRAFCMDKPSADFLMAKAGVRDFIPLSSLYVGYVSRGVLKSNAKLFETVNKGFSQIPQSRIQEINRKWYGTSVAYKRDYKPVLIASLIALFVFIVLIAFILFLRFQVSIKTAELTTHLELLEKSEQWNRAFIQALPDLFFVIDRWGYYVDYNVKDFRLLRTSSNGLIGKNISDIFSSGLVGIFMDAVHDVLQHGGVREVEYDLEVPAGLRHFECRIVSMDKDTALYIARDITERKKIEQEIVKSLHEKEVLLKEKEALFREVHHRVKNNLQIVSSLLTMQSDLFETEQGRGLIREIQNRIQSMAHLHELLYQSNDISLISLQEYFASIVREISVAYHEAFQRISLHLDAGDLKAGMDTALPLGLIINELVSNSVKYAFPGDSRGSIRIFSTVSSSSVCIVACDDGIGMPQGFDPLTSESLGFLLVRSFASQAGGVISYSPEKGSRFEIRLPVERFETGSE